MVYQQWKIMFVTKVIIQKNKIQKHLVDYLFYIIFIHLKFPTKIHL